MARAIHRVAVIGLGRMGGAIARRILSAGFETAVYNRTPSKTAPLEREGAHAARSPKEAASGMDAVVSCLMDDQSVLDSVIGPKGILAGLKRGAVHIGTSTISPACSKHLAELHAAHGSNYIAAPVLGRPDVAAVGRLRTFVAGDPSAIGRCKPVFDAYTEGAIEVGPDHGVASSLKLAVNYMVAALIELMGEVYAFGEKSGIDLDLLENVIGVLFGQPALREYAHRVRARAFDDAGFELAGGLKDVQLILRAATETRAALPYASIIRDKLLAAIANGMAQKDWSAIYEVTRMNAGLK